MNAGSVCKRGVVTVTPGDDPVLRHMRAAGVRRIPVVDRSAALAGVLAIDDVLERIAERLINIAGSIRNEQRMERAVRQ